MRTTYPAESQIRALRRGMLIGFLMFTQAFTQGIYAQSIYAQNNGVTPVGATTAPDLYSPGMAGAGGLITSRGGAPASALNPAAEGETQRMLLNIGYTGLFGLGAERGYGIGAVNLGAIYPTRFAVFGASLWLLSSPFDSFPVQTTFQGNLNVAKEIFPGMSIGVGLNAGYNTGNTWTVSGDLGFRYNMGNLGPLENFTWAVAAKSLGKSWIPPAFTPVGGISFDFLGIRGIDGKPDPIRVNLAADIMLPTMQNLAGKLGLNVVIAEFINISAASQFNLRESLDGKGPSPIPSIGIGVNLKLKPSGGRTIAGIMPADGELSIDLGAKPLYNGIWGMGGGVTWAVGVADRSAPVIIVDYSEPAWISPNNDGKADYLEFPITIRDERYIVEWVFEIMDEGGVPVRVYRNKETRPETQGVQNIVGSLQAVRAGVEVPSSLRWDGIFDSGELAPDGKYFFTITAEDDNGNFGIAGPYEVNVDCTPPLVEIMPFGENMNIFAPGDGSGRDRLIITQTGSAEDLWEGGIYTSLGAKVKTIEFTNQAPVDFEWDGRDDSGTIVNDGVYNYRIGATDRALNTGGAALENIIVNTVRPAVSLAISDAYFSPNGDGVKDTMIFMPTVPVREGIAGWELRVSDFSGTVRRTLTGASGLPSRIEFDGRDTTGRILPEAIYSGSLLVRYLNGYTSTAVSPPFSLDITAPRASVRIDDPDQGPGSPAVFSPTGDKNRIFIIQEGSNELSWTGEIRRQGDRTGTPVRVFRYSGTPPARIEWDGFTTTGALASDDFYTYELYSVDSAGNTGRSNIVEFEIDTRDTPVYISTDYRAFSPNGDGVKDTINLIPQIQERAGISSWKIEITAAGTASSVRTFEGSDSVPSQVSWNGRNTAGTAAPDGSYTARIDLEYRSGNRPFSVSTPFVLDTVPPQGDLSVPYNIFAPNGNGNRETLPIQASTRGDDEWSLVVSGRDASPVRTWNWTGSPRVTPVVWDGKDEAGNIVPNGNYSLTLSATDEAGNSTRRTVNNIEVDATVPRIFLTASSQAIAPRANQAEAMRFNIVSNINSGINSWKLELRDENNDVVKTFPSAAGGSGTLPAVIPWNGTDDSGRIREGRFTSSLAVSYTKGDEVNVSAPPVTVDITGPILGLYFEPEYFSPDNDGVNDELFIHLSARDASPIADWSLEIHETEGTGQLFYRVGGRGSPSERIIWDGRSNRGELVQSASDYEFTYTASDALGNSSTITGIMGTDVLVIRDGDILRIQIPSITFRAYYADFIGIPQDRLENNIRVLRRVAEILNRFRDYRIVVEGHANPVLGTAREEDETLMPLSLARAEFTIEQLGTYGVSRNRLSPVGRGGTINVANPQDQANSWKNRRVEFLLIR